MNFRHTTGSVLAACTLVAVLGACGGGFDEATPTQDLASAPSLESTAQAPVRRGDQMTRAGLYASRAQARALDVAAHSDVVWVNDMCCNGDDGTPDSDLALGIVAGLMAARGLPVSAPVLVDLPDRRQAAVLADRLTAAGYTRVVLVTG